MQRSHWSLNSLLIKHSLISLNHCGSVAQIFCKSHKRLFIFVLIVSLHQVILRVTLLLTFPAPEVCVPAKLFYFSLQECFESIWKYLKVFIQRSTTKKIILSSCFTENIYFAFFGLRSIFTSYRIPGKLVFFCEHCTSVHCSPVPVFKLSA